MNYFTEKIETNFMTKQEIKEVTDRAKSPCLVGMRGFDEDIQQFTCKCFNGNLCQCYTLYKNALDNYIKNKKPIVCN